MTTRIGAGAPDGSPLEGLRIPAFTATSVCLGVVAHVAAGGSPPGTGVILLVVFAVAVTSASLRRRERGLPSIVLGVALVQVGLHVALLAGHEHVNAPVADARPAMLLAHMGAVVSLAWWLRRGERAVWQAAVEVWRRHVRLPSMPVSPDDSLRDTPATPCGAGITRTLALVTPVRGPPAQPLPTDPVAHLARRPPHSRGITRQTFRYA